MAPCLQRWMACTLCSFFSLVTGSVDVVAGALAAISEHEDEGCNLPNFTQMALNHHRNL